MGIRGEVFSKVVQLDKRTYFFNVKENRFGDLYLNIVESKNKEAGGFERQSIVLFSEDLKDFLTGFDEALKVLEKSNREKQKKPVRNRQAVEGEAPWGKKPFNADSVRSPGGESGEAKKRTWKKKDDADSAPRSNAGRPTSGRPAGGRSASGKPTGGRPGAGRTGEGRSGPGAKGSFKGEGNAGGRKVRSVKPRRQD